MIKHFVVTMDDDIEIARTEEVQIFVGVEDGDIEAFVVVYPCTVTDPTTDQDINLQDYDDLAAWADTCGYGKWFLTDRLVI
jgi:hypothetical protein